MLLKNNNNALPVSSLQSTIKYVVLIGERIASLNRQTRVRLFQHYDNLGMQCGGWTVRWQGILGNEYWPNLIKADMKASSILDGLK